MRSTVSADALKTSEAEELEVRAVTVSCFQSPAFIAR